MQHVLLKFGIYHFVVIDNRNPFKAMYTSLVIDYEFISKRNHKVLTVERLRCFFNQAVISATSDRGTVDVFVPADIVATYT